LSIENPQPLHSSQRLKFLFGKHIPLDRGITLHGGDKTAHHVVERPNVPSNSSENNHFHSSPDVLVSENGRIHQSRSSTVYVARPDASSVFHEKRENKITWRPKTTIYRTQHESHREKVCGSRDPLRGGLRGEPWSGRLSYVVVLVENRGLRVRRIAGRDYSVRMSKPDFLDVRRINA
jgi:hypothetical protein